MRSRFGLLALSLLPLAPAGATDISPSVSASIHDQPPDGAGDSFNAPSFSGIILKTATVEDRAIQEFDISSLAGSPIVSVTVAGIIQVNNSNDTGVRGFNFGIYGGNGTADLSDYQVPAALVGSASYHPPTDSSVAYSFDVTSVVQSLLAVGSTWIGLRVQSSTNPNAANVLNQANSRLTIVVSPTTGTSYCPGDGTGTQCPCNNHGSLGNGCANSSFGSGAQLTATGNAGTSAGTDTLVLTASNISGPGLFFQGTTSSAGSVFGDGIFCVSGTITRLGVVFPSGSSASYPGGLTPNPIHVAGAPIAAGNTRRYQCWYRDALTFCTASTFNLTQGLSIPFGP